MSGQDVLSRSKRCGTRFAVCRFRCLVSLFTRLLLAVLNVPLGWGMISFYLGPAKHERGPANASQTEHSPASTNGPIGHLANCNYVQATAHGA